VEFFVDETKKWFFGGKRERGSPDLNNVTTTGAAGAFQQHAKNEKGRRRVVRAAIVRLEAGLNINAAY
jgi:hypothetical protein